MNEKILVKKEILDLNDQEIQKEDSEKLYKISPKGEILAIRSNDHKGVKFISLLDGGLISEINYMHRR